VVADDFAGKGLGIKLVDMLIGIGEEKGLETIYGIVLPENTKMMGLCRALGFDIKYGSGEVEVELKLAGRGKDS
jgi:acetyltransferase